jgi:hypothetical protein
MTAPASVGVSHSANNMEVVLVSDHLLENQNEDQQQKILEQTDDDDSYRSGDVSQSSPSAYTDSSRTGRNKRYNHDGNLDSDFGGKETKALVIWKVVVISVMVLITVGASVAVFVYVDSKEQSSFEENFEDDALKIFSDLGKNIIQRFAQLDSLAMAMVSYTNVSGNTDWPFVTIPNYAVRASKARTNTGALAIENFYYIQDSVVTEWKNSSRKEWEQYTREQGNQWVSQALVVQDIDDSYVGARLSDDVVVVEHSDIWYGSEVVPENRGP